MPVITTKAAGSAQGYGEFTASAPKVYIEDVFSTYLYTGTGSTQTITNGIGLSTKGGLVWVKGRSGTGSIGDHCLIDTARGANLSLASNLTNGSYSISGGGNTSPTFTATGFTTGNFAAIGAASTDYASWTFRKQPKFFDVVTYTGDGVGAGKTVNHNLNSTPGAVIIKRTDSTGFWWTKHRSLSGSDVVALDDTFAAYGSGSGASDLASTSFTANGLSNVNGGTYVAYLFAHDAGGFGLTGTDNVISCGSYTGNGSATGPVVTLGWEPQWVLIKCSSSTGDWNLIDNMRGFVVGGTDSELNPNLQNAESTGTFVSPTATGFQINTTGAGYNSNGNIYIYIAIRRGPMKVPTSGTSVFSPKGAVTLTSGQTVTTGFVTDMSIAKFNGTQEWLLSDRLRNTVLYPNTTDAEGGLYGAAGPRPFDVQDGFKTTSISSSYFLWGFRRAPGFFDVVCYTGNGTNPRNINHNLAAIPELMIIKRRGPSTQNWLVYHSALTAAGGIILNTNSAATNPAYFWNATPTATEFSTQLIPNSTGENYVAYLFATLAGVSKVGSYTGSGTTKQIDCGFTGGARFILIKRTDSTGDWHLYDSGQGIISGNDPYLLLNTSDGQYVGTDYVDTYSAGFELSSTAPAGLNANGGTYIFLAIA